jgi:hypothetical protein
MAAEGLESAETIDVGDPNGKRDAVACLSLEPEPHTGSAWTHAAIEYLGKRRGCGWRLHLSTMRVESRPV